MPKFFINKNQIQNNKIVIIGSDVNHIKNVLRLQEKDQIEVCNPEAQENFLCEIQVLSESQIECSIKEKMQKSTESNVRVTIFQGLPKADKMEFIIQKAVELGAYDITPVEMARCIVKLNGKDKVKKIERWQKISEVAAKQCQRDIIPQINDIIELKNIINLIEQYDVIILAYEKEDKNSIKQELKNIKKQGLTRIGIIIGPEGGLEEKEVKDLKEKGVKVITLGKRILRTETVALNVLSNIMYELEE